MVVNLANITFEDIRISTINCVRDTSTLIAYLQNNGDKNHCWDNEKFFSIINEDIDD